jgi:hypothetical protein
VDIYPEPLEDGGVRDDVIAFRHILGGAISLAPASSKFTPASEAQWQKDAADKLIARERKLQATRYAGLSLEEKEEIARQAEREQKALSRRLPERRCKP